jgi:hypothetical protein
MNGALCWDCNIISYLFIYLHCKVVGRESRQTVHKGGSWAPEIQIFMLRSILANILNET